MSCLANQDGSHIHPGTSLKGIKGRCFPKRKARPCLQPKGQERGGHLASVHPTHPCSDFLQLLGTQVCRKVLNISCSTLIFSCVSLVCPSLCELLRGAPGSFVQEHLDAPGHQGHAQHTKGTAFLCVLR